MLLKVPAGSTSTRVVNIGPSHPAMHGTFRVQALLDGETIVDAEAEIGYMHRNFEKMAEIADLLADHPLHRPAQLLLVLHERPRLGPGRGEAAGRRRRRRGPRPSA